jgi:hypothetical protein
VAVVLTHERRVVTDFDASDLNPWHSFSPPLRSASRAPSRCGHRQRTSWGSAAAAHRPPRRSRSFATADLMRARFSGLRASLCAFLAMPARIAARVSLMSTRTPRRQSHPGYCATLAG